MSLNSCDLPPLLVTQFPIQDLDFDSFRLNGQTNGLTGFEDVFGDLDNDPVALQQLLSNYNDPTSDLQDSGSTEFFDNLTGPIARPVENPTTEIDPVQQHNQTTCADIENLLLPTTEIEHDLLQHLVQATDIGIQSFPTIGIEHGPSQQFIQTACANNEPLLPTTESKHDPIQFRIQNACVTTQDPSDFFFKSFAHPKNDLKRIATTVSRNPTYKKRKTSEEKQYNLCSAKEESEGGNEDNLEKIKAWGGMELVSEPPKTLIDDARSLGIRSVLPLFRKSTEAAEKSTRKSVAKQLDSMQISAEWYLQIQAAAKEYMLDDRYPERMGVVGLKTRAGADSSDLFNCCLEFLEQEWGENCWGIMADFYEGRTLLWPKNKTEITNRVIPLLRRAVTNERQRLYAAEKRRGQKNGNFGECSQTTKSHSNTPKNQPNTPITSNTSPGQMFPQGHQARKIDEYELRSRLLESPSPFPADTNIGQYSYNSTPERNPDISRRISTSGKMSGTSVNESDLSLATHTDTAIEASMLYPTEDTTLHVEPTIKLHIDFLQCGRQVKERVIMNVTTHTTLSSFVQNIRSMIAGDLMMLKNIQVQSSERSVDVDNPGTWNMVLVEVVNSVGMDSEAKVLVEVEEDLFGEEREVSPFVTLL